MGDHFQIIDTQEVGGQQCINVYCYEVTDGVTNALDVAESFKTNVIVHMQDLQNITVTHTLLEVFNLDNLADFATIVPALAGVVTGQSLPVFAAFSIKFPRTTRASRNGWKRLPGVSETDQDGGALTVGALANLSAVANFIDGPITTELTFALLEHRLWRRPREGVEQAFFALGPGQPNDQVTTQNTRKPGRGI